MARDQFLQIGSSQLKQAQVKLQNLRVGITAGKEVTVSASGNYFQKMQSRSASILRDTRWYIRESKEVETKTGRERKANGGKYAGRYLTGKMHDAFVATKGNGITMLNNKKVRFHVDFGWLRGMPQYTLFQELGTQDGIRAMNALGRAQQEIEWQMMEEMTNDMKQLARDIRGDFLGSIRGTRRRNATALGSTWRQVLSSTIDEETD